MAAARVLLVDDDAAIRRLVALVLEDLDIDLLACADVAQALRALRQAPVQLVITDLMMPGTGGEGLLRQLAAEPGLRANARIVVFSAGLDPATQARLRAAGVWRLLPKPVAVRELADCVLQALQPAGAELTLEPPRDAVAAEDEATAIACHFGGDEALFRAYRAGCLRQFPCDLEDGARAWAAADAPALCRLGHNLKGVLRSLGHGREGDTAQALETAAANADWPALPPLWDALQRALRGLGNEAAERGGK